MPSNKKENKKTCFVVGPIGGVGTPTRTHADWLLEGIIIPVFEKHFSDFIVERADKITQPGMIDAQVITRLLDSALVIADMSLLNANAFYEMGIRHMAQKPIIHMFLDGSEIPFDVKPYRAIPFSVVHPKDLVDAQEALRNAITDAIAENHFVDNPVTRARGQLNLEQHATPEQRLILQEISDLRSRIAEIDHWSPPSGLGSDTLFDRSDRHYHTIYVMPENPHTLSRSQFNELSKSIDALSAVNFNEYRVNRQGDAFLIYVPKAAHNFPDLSPLLNQLGGHPLIREVYAR